MVLFLAFTFGFILFQPFSQLYAQDRSDPVKLTRINNQVNMDGYTNEPFWDSIQPLPLVSYEPVGGLPPSEETEVRIAYDDNYIYASLRAYDSEPSEIRINSLYRDRLSGDDLFHILLDTYNDNESAVAFTITPAGVKRDATISNDGEGPNALNADFNTYWDVATRVDERGWFAEIRVPFSSLGFQDEDGHVRMGLYVQRGISRKNERITFPEVPPNIARAYFKPSLAQKVDFEEIYSSRPLHITPYLRGGFEQEYRLNETQDNYSRKDIRELEAGFDIKYGISNNMTLDLTVNTDFAQVEADDQQVNLTRFNLFFPEKRQFFQERSGVFEFNTGGNGRLYQSRRIGLTDEGEQVRILAGARLTGRIGEWDLGFLNMQTDRYQGMPGENFGVFRLRRTLFNPYSYAGAMITSRLDAEGSYNVGYGFDGSIRLKEDDYLSYALAQTVDEEKDLSFSSTTRFRLGLERRSREGFAYQTEISRSGDAYNPESGFVPRIDYFRVGQGFRYGWLPGSESPLLWHSIQMKGAVFWRTTTGRLESVEIGPVWEATTKPGAQIQASLTWHYEDIPEPFRLLSRTTIPAGTYKFFRGVAGYQIASSRLIRAQLEVDTGTFYGGWRTTLDFSPTWNVSRHLELEASYLYNLVNVVSTEDWFAAHVGQLKIRTALNTKLSTHAFLQFNSTADLIAANVRFRYNIRDGNDLWIVYNEGVHTHRDRMEPRLPFTDARTIMIKYTHTFHR